MAGDWIKMRVDLQNDPTVDRIAESMDDDTFTTVGRLHAFWSWVDKHAVDGHVDGASSRLVDKVAMKSGFAAALIQAGWLVIDETGISIPHFDRHNGESAKERSLKNARQARWRAGKDAKETAQASTRPSTGASTREEKRREELKTEGSKSACSETGASEISNAPARAVDLSIVLRESGIDSTPSDPRLQALAEQGVSVETARAAAQKARAAKPNERISTGYVAAIITGWAADAAKVQASGAVVPTGKPAKFDPVAFVNRNRPTESHERTPDCIDVEAKHVA